MTAGPRLTLELVGLEATLAAVGKVRADVEAATDPALMAGGEVIAAEWRSRLPEGPEPGHIRDAIIVTPTDDGVAIGVGILEGVPEAHQPYRYARRLEYGGGGMDAQPAARPAADRNHEKVAAAAGRILGDAAAGRRR